MLCPMMEPKMLWIVVFCCLQYVCVSTSLREQPLEEQRNATAKEKWNYVKVREDAFMFWWLYYTTAQEAYAQKPLILWLQGGPGSSSTGFGNFEELGPLDDNLKPRNTSWVTQANVLFIDNPVGTGFSYVTDESAYTKDLHGISADLVTVIKAFLVEVPEFKTVPFYIFSESYGGKMAAGLAQQLNQAVQSGSIQCNFQGLAMGDSWISPIDSVLTWGPYLYATSVVDAQGLAAINKTAQETKAAVDKGRFKQATDLWSETENVLESVSNGVNFYNILEWGQREPSQDSGDKIPNTKTKGHIESLFRRHVANTYNGDLSSLMNGPIRKKLGIIPRNVTWGGQAGQVFSHLSGDFMKPVVDIVDDLLKSRLKVVVYQGQLDLIVDTPGTERWLRTLKWIGLPGYKNSPRKAFYTRKGDMAGFVKSYKNFSFYWIMKAGHMVPKDTGDAAIKMVDMITS